MLRDLEPYICTFSACGLDRFHSQHAWFEHELLVHRSRWICSLCSADIISSDGLKNHVKQQHQGLVSSPQLSAFVGQSRRPVDCVKPSECPFCDDSWAQADSNHTSREEVLVVSLDQFRQHLGKHLQQVALFSLPRLSQDHDQSLGRHNDSKVPDRDAISEGSRWIRDDCGYGWSIVSRRRATFFALACLLNLCPAQETYALPAISYQDGAYKGRSYYGNRDLIQLLIDRGTIVGAGQEQYNEALQAAAYEGYEDMIKPLLDRNADVNAQDGKYGNVLQAAEYGGHGDIVQQLLREGVELRSIPHIAKPPVSYAVSESNMQQHQMPPHAPPPPPRVRRLGFSGIHGSDNAFNHMHVDPSGQPFVHNMQQPTIQLSQPPGFGPIPDPHSIPSVDKPPIGYIGYTFTKHPIKHVGQKETWAIINKELIPASQADLKNQVEKQRRKAGTGLDQYNNPDMKGFKRKQVDELIRECAAMELDHRFEYTIASIKRDTKRRSSGPETSAMQVILRRQTRPGVTVQGPYVGLDNLRLPMSGVVDLSLPDDGQSTIAEPGSPI